MNEPIKPETIHWKYGYAHGAIETAITMLRYSNNRKVQDYLQTVYDRLEATPTRED